MAINTPVVAKACLSSSSGQRPGKRRKLEERTGGALSAAAAASTSSAGGGLLPPPKIDSWAQELLQKHPGCRVLQRLSVIFSDVSDLQAVVLYETL